MLPYFKKRTAAKVIEILMIISIIILLFLFVFSDYEYRGTLFLLSLCVLSFFYLIAAYWLFKTDGAKKGLLSIISGIAFAIAIFSLIGTIRPYNDLYFYLLPILNIVLFFGLAIFHIIKRKSKELLKNYKGIFIRSGIILLITCFFAYLPIQFKPYRKALLVLNNDSPYYLANIRMFDYFYLYEKTIKKENYNKALEYAEKMNQEGKLWLEIISQEEYNQGITKWSELYQDSLGISRLQDMEGAISSLFYAYTYKINDCLKNKQYEESLKYCLKSDTVYALHRAHSHYWKTRQAELYNLKAFTYEGLGQYEQAYEFYAKAIDYYASIQEEQDKTLAIYYHNLAMCFQRQNYYQEANALLIKEINILTDISLSDNKQEIIDNYFYIVYNSFAIEEYENALNILEQLGTMIDKPENQQCYLDMFYGLYFYRTNLFHKADSIFTNCIDCYKQYSEINQYSLSDVFYLLAQTKISLAQYQQAREYLEQSIGIIEKTTNYSRSKYANCLFLLGKLEKQQSNYTKAQDAFGKALQLYSNEMETKQLEVWIELGELKLIFGEYKQAQSYADKAWEKISEMIDDYTKPNHTTSLNSVAYINYYNGFYLFADTLYQKAMNIHNQFPHSKDLNKSGTLNGLALLAIEKKQYPKADTLLKEAIELSKGILSENHPYTASLFLNYGILKIKQNKLEEAKQLLNKSLKINKQYFESSHDVFGDIYIVLGDLAVKEKQSQTAKDYYQNALVIYQNKFGDEHAKVLQTKQKIK